jgi:ATP-dependent Clp protease protease subunit
MNEQELTVSSPATNTEPSSVAPVAVTPPAANPISDHTVVVKDIWGDFEGDEIVGYGRKFRSCLLLEEITEATSALIISQIRAFNAISDEPIHIDIHSVGGEINSSMAIADAIQASKAPIIGTVMGLAASGAFLVLQACDYRLSFPNSFLFYHEPVSESQVSSKAEQEENTKFYKISLNRMNEIIRNRTGMDKSKFSKTFAGKTCLYFTPEEAIKANLLDEIIAPIGKIPMTKEQYRSSCKKTEDNKPITATVTVDDPSKIAEAIAAAFKAL